jgi:hypothetical protein
MKNSRLHQDLGERIERLVREYISDIHVAARVAMDRAFTTHVDAKAKQKQQPRKPLNSSSKRRASAEVAELGERFYEVVRERPGETMTVLAPAIGATARELHRPVAMLKHSGRIRSVGSRSAMRYFPMRAEALAAE